MYVKKAVYSLDVLPDNKILPGFIRSCDMLVKSLGVQQPKKRGLILSAGNTTWFGTYEGAKYKAIPLLTSEILAARWADMLGALDWVSTDGSACASFAVAMKQAEWLLNDLEEVVIVSLDNGTSSAMKDMFSQFGIIREDSTFKLSFGCAVVVLSNEPTDAISEVLEVSVKRYRGDNAMSDYLEGYLAVAPEVSVDYVKVHGTNTDVNTESEKFLVDKYKNAEIISYKKVIGHTMGSAGGVEFCMALDSRTGIHFVAGMGGMYGAILVKGI